MPDRRAFLHRATGTLGAVALAPAAVLDAATAQGTLAADLASVLDALGDRAAPEVLATDEPFWARVRRAMPLHPTIVNLDHGWTNPTPSAALDALLAGARDLEAIPADRLPRFWEETTNVAVRRALAEVMGVPPGELALVRNATEALDIVLLGVPLAAGDEVLCSRHDYYAMLDALEQRRARDGVVLRLLDPPVPAPSLDALAALYEAAIGPRTKLVLLTHPSNLTGQLLPVRRIAAAAHAVGARVVVDGAQSLGLLDDPVRSLDCDFYGASLHKWLGAPVGLGVLWMRPAHVATTWPLIPGPVGATGMARFEWIGTNPEYVGPAVLPALALHREIGPARKAARLRHLATYWRTRVAAAFPSARFSVADEPGMQCGLATVTFPGVQAEPLQKALLADHRILVQPMAAIRSAPGMDAIRVTPNVYTTPAELDRLVAALRTLVRVT